MDKNKKLMKKNIPECILVLHDIRSITNVGAMFRTADAVGVTNIILSGITPAPIDRFGRTRSDFTKASLGAEDSIPWKQVMNITTTLAALKKQEYTIYTLEQDPHSVDYKSVKIKKSDKIVLIPGNEVSGVSKKIINRADHILEIPMHGIKESLNISVAVGIVLYRLLDQ
jgi:tRNA G18 (ribose-2'-O)-methylase SpoU